MQSPMIFGLVTLVFFLSRLLPGDPASLYVVPGILRALPNSFDRSSALIIHCGDQYLGLGLPRPSRGELGYSVCTCGAPSGMFSCMCSPILFLLGRNRPSSSSVSSQWVLAALAVRSVGSLVRSRPFKNDCSLVYSLPSFWVGILFLLNFLLLVQGSCRRHRCIPPAESSWALAASLRGSC